MFTPKYLIALSTLALMLVASNPVQAAPKLSAPVPANAGGFHFGWGHADVWRSGNTTSLRFSVAGCDGSGTADVRFVIRYPSGRREEYRVVSGAVRGGSFEALLNFDGAEVGHYTATCFWRIDNSGFLDGDHDVVNIGFDR